MFLSKILMSKIWFSIMSNKVVKEVSGNTVAVRELKKGERDSHLKPFKHIY